VFRKVSIAPLALPKNTRAPKLDLRMLQKIVNVIIEKPVELIKYKDRIVEVEVEKIVEVPVEVRRRALNSQYRSAGTLKGTPGL
jgi:hypothetical protein